MIRGLELGGKINVSILVHVEGLHGGPSFIIAGNFDLYSTNYKYPLFMRKAWPFCQCKMPIYITPLCVRPFAHCFTDDFLYPILSPIVQCKFMLCRC
jgi:hypothetical protein